MLPVLTPVPLTIGSQRECLAPPAVRVTPSLCPAPPPAREHQIRPPPLFSALRRSVRTATPPSLVHFSLRARTQEEPLALISPSMLDPDTRSVNPALPNFTTWKEQVMAKGRCVEMDRSR